MDLSQLTVCLQQCRFLLADWPTLTQTRYRHCSVKGGRRVLIVCQYKYRLFKVAVLPSTNVCFEHWNIKSFIKVFNIPNLAIVTRVQIIIKIYKYGSRWKLKTETGLMRQPRKHPLQSPKTKSELFSQLFFVKKCVMEREMIMFVVFILTVNSKGLNISHLYFKGKKSIYCGHFLNTK